jgi:hypothetical protein
MAVMEVLWSIDSTAAIGGHRVQALGSPRVISLLDGGRAVEFSGAGDGLFVHHNPAEGLAAFTTEIMFMPYRGGPTDQRFLHMQEAAEGSGNRVLLETRNNGWAGDGLSPVGDSGNVTGTLPADAWFADACLQVSTVTGYYSSTDV